MRTISEELESRLHSSTCPFCLNSLSFSLWWNGKGWEAKMATCVKCMNLYKVIGEIITVEKIGMNNLHLVS
jgi:hypothetical protein